MVDQAGAFSTGISIQIILIINMIGIFVVCFLWIVHLIGLLIFDKD